MYTGSNCDRKSQFSEILTEPSNPHAGKHIEIIGIKHCQLVKLEKTTIFLMRRGFKCTVVN